MMTVITRVSLKPGCEPEWDETMRQRLSAVHDQSGWISGQMLMPLDGPDNRVIVGTWKARSDWEAWHEDPAFKETRDRLEKLQKKSDDMEWFEVAIGAPEATAV